jgi:hypothetical protein
MIPRVTQYFRILEGKHASPRHPFRCIAVEPLGTNSHYGSDRGPLWHITARLSEPGYGGKAHECYFVVDARGRTHQGILVLAAPILQAPPPLEVAHLPVHRPTGAAQLELFPWL